MNFYLKNLERLTDVKARDRICEDGFERFRGSLCFGLHDSKNENLTLLFPEPAIISELEIEKADNKPGEELVVSLSFLRNYTIKSLVTQYRKVMDRFLLIALTQS